MKGRLFLFLAALVLFLPAVIGTAHLSFASNSTQVDITRDGCGTQKMCFDIPKGCDPASNTSMCLFASGSVVMLPTGSIIPTLELRGHSTGYIALGLSSGPRTQGFSKLFVCRENGGNFSFNTAKRNNSSPNTPPILIEKNVTEIRGVVKDNIIRCEFNIPGLSFSELPDTVLLGSGNVTNGSLDTFNVQLTMGTINLLSLITSPSQTLNITRTGCGTSKLCLETPDICDPAGNKTCLFTSIVVNNSMPPNGADLLIELRGDSNGYIALGFVSTASMDTAKVFVCGQLQGRVLFRTLKSNISDPNPSLTPVNKEVKDTRGEVNGNVIKCSFRIPNVNSTQTKNAATTFTILLGSGSFSGNSFGLFNVILRKRLNVADPTLGSNVTAQGPSGTTVPPVVTTCDAVSFHPHALLLLSALVLSIMLRN